MNRVIEQAVRKRDGVACVYCGNIGQMIDHVWPRALGGKDTLNNLVLACYSCNTKKKRNGPYFHPMLTQGLKHLLSVGESLDWIPEHSEGMAYGVFPDIRASFTSTVEPQTIKPGTQLQSYLIHRKHYLRVIELYPDVNELDLLRVYRVNQDTLYWLVDVYADVAICDCWDFEDDDWCDHAEAVYLVEQHWTKAPESDWGNRPG